MSLQKISADHSGDVALEIRRPQQARWQRRNQILIAPAGFDKTAMVAK
jgi:hypothetical protein